MSKLRADYEDMLLIHLNPKKNMNSQIFYRLHSSLEIHDGVGTEFVANKHDAWAETGKL